MLNYKKNWRVFAFLLMLIVSSCMEQKVLFSFNENVKPSFFKNIPGIGSDIFFTDTVISKATSLQVYKSSFREQYIEKDHLLDITELNDSTALAYADYWEFIGYSQDMYLLKYQFKVRPKKKPSAKVHTIDAILFFSVKYNKSNDCIGFGPSYFGTVDYYFGDIAFPTELSTKANGADFYLKPLSKVKANGGYLFFATGLTGADNKNNLNIKKIVKLDMNKVGSYKPLVFNIEKIFKDPNALLFHYETTLTLTQ
jgi:hypothetical protein